MRLGMRHRWITVLAASLCFAAVGCGDDESSDLNNGRRSGFEPLPDFAATAAVTSNSTAQINLGRQLYFEPRLSTNGDLSDASLIVTCNDCHRLDDATLGCADGEALRKVGTRQRIPRNSPSSCNAAVHTSGQFWDVREPTVEAQALGPILSDKEMGSDKKQDVLNVLAGIPDYVTSFNTALGVDLTNNGAGWDRTTDQEAEPVKSTFAAIGTAIGAFERGLMTPSKWDDFLNGNDDALTPEELAGLDLFIATGCRNCHNSAALGGNIVVKPSNDWEKQVNNSADGGAGESLPGQFPLGSFKAPSLRNIENTGPYFHNGSEPNLQEAIRKMAESTAGATLTDAEVASIETFLKALTGQVKDPNYIKTPCLPAGLPPAFDPADCTTF